MKISLKIYHYIIALLLFGGCSKVEVENPVTPFSIKGHLLNEPNYLINAFALPNNTIIIQTRGNNIDTFSTFFQYNSELQLIRKLSIPVFDISEPVIEDNGTFTIATYSFQTGDEVYNIDYELNVIKKRYIGNLYLNVPFTTRYPPILSKLTNGNYIIGNNNGGDAYAKISLICVKDLFKDTRPVWSWLNQNTGFDWIANITTDADNTFAFTGFVNYGGSGEVFFQKHDVNGNFVFRKTINGNNGFNSTTLNIEKERWIFCEKENFYFFDPSGTEIGKEPIPGEVYQNISNLVKKGENYFYFKEVFNLDGQFAEIRKTDKNLKVIKSKKLGNQGTNNNGISKRVLLKMNSGELILICMIKNPNLSGNQWLMVRLNEDLEFIN